MLTRITLVGYTETETKSRRLRSKSRQIPIYCIGQSKSRFAGHSGGFVKLVFDAKYGELLGAHMIGYNVTEMIAEIVAARKLETTGHEIIKAVHPHPTMSEAVMEAAAAAYGEVIHL